MTERFQPYARHLALALLHQFAAALPSAVAVGTDVNGDLRSFGQRALMVETRRGKLAQLSLRGDWTHGPELARFANALAVTPGTVAGLQDAVESLYALNSRGRWCLHPQDPEGEARRLGLDGVCAELIEDEAGRLTELLPRVVRLEADVLTRGRADGKVSRRSWVRYVGAAEHECASIDTALMWHHVRDGLLRNEHRFLRANLARMDVWAAQLGLARTEDLPEVFVITTFLVTTLRFDRVMLGDPVGLPVAMEASA